MTATTTPPPLRDGRVARLAKASNIYLDDERLKAVFVDHREDKEILDQAQAWLEETIRKAWPLRWLKSPYPQVAPEWRTATEKLPAFHRGGAPDESLTAGSADDKEPDEGWNDPNATEPLTDAEVRNLANPSGLLDDQEKVVAEFDPFYKAEKGYDVHLPLDRFGRLADDLKDFIQHGFLAMAEAFAEGQRTEGQIKWRVVSRILDRSARGDDGYQPPLLFEARSVRGDYYPADRKRHRQGYSTGRYALGVAAVGDLKIVPVIAAIGVKRSDLPAMCPDDWAPLRCPNPVHQTKRKTARLAPGGTYAQCWDDEREGCDWRGGAVDWLMLADPDLAFPEACQLAARLQADYFADDLTVVSYSHVLEDKEDYDGSSKATICDFAEAQPVTGLGHTYLRKIARDLTVYARENGVEINRSLKAYASDGDGTRRLVWQFLDGKPRGERAVRRIQRRLSQVWDSYLTYRGVWPARTGNTKRSDRARKYLARQRPKSATHSAVTGRGYWQNPGTPHRLHPVMLAHRYRPTMRISTLSAA